MDEVTISDEDRRLLGLWAANCAERALPLFEATAPSDTRPREALEGIRAYAREEIRKGPLRALATAALAAARDAGDPAATAAARAAGYAAAAPYIHALASPHQAKHALASAMYGALARERVAGAAAGDEEIRWAIGTRRMRFARSCGRCRSSAPAAAAWTRSATRSIRLFATRARRGAPPLLRCV